MQKFKYQILICGDCAVTINFGNSISMEMNKIITGFVKELKRTPIVGVSDLIPTYSSLTICYNPAIIGFKEICREIAKRIENIKISDDYTKRVVVIPVCYDEEFGEDLSYVADHANLSIDEVIQLHTSTDYLIYMLGFLPGFAYLGGLDNRLVTPRLETPRPIIPARSVGIGGEQTGIYPLTSPGGWRLIGRTPVKPYDPTRKEPFLYVAGDFIRFKSISKKEFYEIENLVSIKKYSCEILEVEV